MIPLKFAVGRDVVRGGTHRLSPAKLQSLLQNAIGQHRAGRLEEADRVYRQVRAAAPRNFDVQHLSGLVAYQLGRIPEAIELLGRAYALQPSHAVCEMRLGLALLAARRSSEAEAHFRHTVAQNPAFAEGWDNLAYCLKTQDRMVEAVPCHEQAVKARPDYAVGWYNFGLTLNLLGRNAEAVACHERALAADPAYALPRFGRAQALHQANRIPEAIADYDRFLTQQPQNHEARSYRLFALHNLDGIAREQLFAEHVAYGRAVGTPPAPVLPNVPDPQRPIRLAILSPDLRKHSCAYFLAPLLRHLDRTAFELYLYHDHFREDAVSARFRARAAVWRNFVGQPAALVEKTIRADAPDILIDLAGHTGMTSRLPLFARRLAPVQITYLGYPNTTGLPAMDYRLTDALADPVGEADAFATETLVRFAPTAWTYEPPAEAPAPVAAPCLARGHVTFGCCNSLAKITDAMLVTWGDLLRQVPGARLRLKGGGLGAGPGRDEFVQRFARTGVLADRVDLVERTAETRDHLAAYGDVDIALDTFPYHGTTTTCEALWMGVPVVSLTGDRHLSRVGTSLLAAAGHPEWSASDAADYVRIAAGLAADPRKLAELRVGLRSDLMRGPLLDHAGQAARWSDALRQCWTAWCDRSPARLAASADR